jgi:hypothetical protein
MDIKMQIPFAVDLTKEKGWSKDSSKYNYFIVRLNLLIKPRKDEKHLVYIGDQITPFRTTDFVTAGETKTYEYTYSIIDAAETTRTTLIENEFVSSISSEIGAEFKFPAGFGSATLSPKITSSLEQSVKSSITRSMTNTRTISTEEKKTLELRVDVMKGASETQYAVPAYKKYRWDVFLHYIDFLFVEYRPTALGLRKKKTNLPRPEGMNHTNRIRMNLPLFSLLFWEYIPGGQMIFTESEYRLLPNKVEDPGRVLVEELRESIDLQLPPRPEKPTLYTLSNIAFPLRWIDRKGEWTKEELMKIELDEADGSAWWFEYGPGRKRNPS